MKTRFLMILPLLLTSGIARAEQAVVLSAAATSSAPGSATVTCLLDPACQGVWLPGAADNGTDDGLYIQFEKPVAIDYVRVSLDGGTGSLASSPNYELYLNGRTRNKKGPYEEGSGDLEEIPGTIVFGIGNTADPGIDPLKENVRSVFLKMNPVGPWQPGGNRVKKIEFLTQKGPSVTAVVPLTLPRLIPASVTATSILEPVSAYHPSNLFDSRYDFAWSTDGKKTPGKGESVTLTLPTPQTLSGLMLWNGYQRSPEHFKANGRVLSLEVQADAQPPQSVKLTDQMGPQKITFNPPLANARQVKFTIREIAAGSSYKDVLISEMRLLGAAGELLLPQTELPRVVPPAGFQGLIDRSFASILHQPVWGDLEVLGGPDYRLSRHCDNARIRLRGNGTFVIYKDFNYGKTDSAQRPTNINANVLEGNWEPKGDKLRIFGRKYVTALQQSEYLAGAVAVPSRTEIFQSEVSVKPYMSLTPQEKTALFAYLWQKKKGPAAKNQKFLWVIGNINENRTVAGGNYDDLVKKMDAELTSLNPYCLNSSVLNDLLLPSDGVDSCFSFEP